MGADGHIITYNWRRLQTDGKADSFYELLFKYINIMYEYKRIEACGNSYMYDFYQKIFDTWDRETSETIYIYFDTEDHNLPPETDPYQEYIIEQEQLWT